MNRELFLTQLKQELQSLSKEEQAEIIADYNEYFDIGMEEGQTEEDIARKLGSPKNIAKELSVSNSLDKGSKNPTVSNVFGAIAATIGLSFFNLIVVLGPALALGGFLLAGWITSVAFIFSPFLQLGSILLGFNNFYAFEVFTGVALCGIGIFLSFAMYYVTLWCSKVFLKYCQWNVSVVKGGMKRA